MNIYRYKNTQRAVSTSLLISYNTLILTFYVSLSLTKSTKKYHKMFRRKNINFNCFLISMKLTRNEDFYSTTDKEYIFLILVK